MEGLIEGPLGTSTTSKKKQPFLVGTALQVAIREELYAKFIADF